MYVCACCVFDACGLQRDYRAGASRLRRAAQRDYRAGAARLRRAARSPCVVAMCLGLLALLLFEL